VGNDRERKQAIGSEKVTVKERERETKEKNRKK